MEGQDSNSSATVTVPTTVSTTVTVSNVTDASGKLSATFTPEIAGTYVMSNEYTGPGGLLATFFRTKDFADPVLENSAHTTLVRRNNCLCRLHTIVVAQLFHGALCGGNALVATPSGRACLSHSTRFNLIPYTPRFCPQEPYHEPAFCPATMVEGCDSTLLVPTLSLDWGTASPLQAWPGLGFPADFFSVRLEGFIKGPVDGVVSFRATADDLLRFTVNGSVVMDTVSAGGNASTSILTADVTMTNGTLFPVTLELVEELDEASMSLLWSYEGDGADNSAPVEIPSSALYYTRHVQGSPVTVSVFPGEVNATTSSFEGDGLVGCVAMEACSFTVTARDAAGNIRFATGSNQWDVTVVGVGDWAAEGRIGEFVSSADAPLSASGVSVTADDWTSLGSVTCVTGESSCTPSTGLSDSLQRGDPISIAGETHVVNPDVDETFDSSSLPLASPFLGQEGPYEVFEIGDNTGKHTVSYTPDVRGDYLVTVKKPAVWETQRVQTVAEPTGEDLSGTFTLTYQGQTTAPIDFNAANTDVQTALRGLSTLTDAIEATPTDCLDPLATCAWLVTFTDVYGDADLLEANADSLGGNAAGVTVVEEVQGQDAMDIGGSPVTVSAVPNVADAAKSTAWGRGLYEATAGETASFVVQARDANRNNRLDSQDSSVFLAVAFAPDADPTDVPPVYGTVAPLGDGLYNVSYTPTYAGPYVLAVLMSTVVETQTFSFVFNSDAEASGRFTLITADGAHETAPISYDATADMVASALSAVEGIGLVEVTREVTSVTSGTASWSYTVSFVSVVGDVPQLTIGSADLVGLLSTAPSAVTAATVTEGEAAHIDTDTDTTSPASVIPEIQVVRISSFSAIAADTFALSFKGHTTGALAVDATGQEVEDALEALSTVGGVSVVQQGVGTGVFGLEYVIKFQPSEGYDLEHYLNYGDMPAIVIESSSTLAASAVDTVVYSGGIPSTGSAATQDGASPFVPVVSPGVVSSEASTPVDADGVADQAGLESAYYEATTSFQIESRDSFGNRVEDGPLKEIQIIELSTDPFGGGLSGSFEVSFQGHSVGLEVGASLAEVEAAIEGLSSVGAVTVSTAAVFDSTDFGVRTADVVYGSPYVTTSVDVSDVLEEGDWLRLCDDTDPDTDPDGLVYAVTSYDASSLTITLDAPYGGGTQTSCALSRHDTKGSVTSYQYIITFDSNVGDLPGLTVDGSGLVASANAAGSATAAIAEVGGTSYHMKASFVLLVQRVGPLHVHVLLLRGNAARPQNQNTTRIFLPAAHHLTFHTADLSIYLYPRSCLFEGDFLHLAPAADPDNQRRFGREWILRGGVHGLPFRAGESSQVKSNTSSAARQVNYIRVD